MPLKKMSILFLGKKDDEHCEKALEFCKSKFYGVTSYLGEWGDPLPKKVSECNG